MIKLERVSGGYGKKQILHEISLDLNKGRIIGIVGPNGSGKSTLLKTIIGINPHTQGTIHIDDQKLSDLKPKDVAKKIAYLAQGKNVADMTVKQMVLHGRFPHLDYPRIYRQEDCEIARKAMEKMKIYDLAERNMETLSGGMRQNVYIAMALAQSTDYIFMDEPTTYLDIANSFQLMNTLEELAKEGKGIVTVMHDLTMALRYASEIVVIYQGRIVGKMTPEELYASDLIKEVFGVNLMRVEKDEGYGYYYGS